MLSRCLPYSSQHAARHRQLLPNPSSQSFSLNHYTPKYKTSSSARAPVVEHVGHEKQARGLGRHGRLQQRQRVRQHLHHLRRAETAQ